MKESFEPDDMLTAKQAAEEAGSCHRTIIAWIHNGWLPAIKRPGLRGKYLIKYSDLMKVANRPYKPKGKDE
jgi:excisionase family DNA binding protein